MGKYERDEDPVVNVENIPVVDVSDKTIVDINIDDESDEAKPITTKTKVYKTRSDPQTSFCGEPVQTDKDGRQYFELADHLKPLVDQHVNVVWPTDK